MIVLQKGEFKRAYKRLHANQFETVNAAIEAIIANPMEGEAKKGDLAGIRVYKFQVQNQLYLLAYDYNDDALTLRALGVHENFYRDLKR
jgi:mRNA-degrading endonuclease YafQ of YafQ-DinJ toxin-antitoxin module